MKKEIKEKKGKVVGKKKTSVNNKKVKSKSKLANKKKNNFVKGISSLKNLCKKYNFIYLFILIIDIILIVYFAKKNVAHYVKLASGNVFIGDSKNLLFGRNYISIIVTAFFYIYWCLIRKFLEKKKLTKKFLILLLLGLSFLNFTLFYLFTTKIY